MTTKCLKNLPKNCKVKYIINDILKISDLVETGNGSYKRVYTPLTDNSCYSNWKIGVEVEYKKMQLIVWFEFSTNRKNIFIDHIFNPVTGKKVRRDAVSNISRKYFYNKEN